jgi:hypothetical protein
MIVVQVGGAVVGFLLICAGAFIYGFITRDRA